MRIKICGITRAEDGRAASHAGADLIGLNFCPSSPRYVGDRDVSALAALLAAVEPPAVPVAVAVDPTKRDLGGLIAAGPRVGPRPFGVVQLHGDEPASLADWLIDRGVKVIKAFRVADEGFAGPVNDWLAEVRRPGGLLAVLLDSARPSPGPAGGKHRARGSRFGGTGRRFNWEWISAAREDGLLAGWPPLVLAGGLTAANVGKAVRIARPWGVDVSGGVEVDGSPGVKSLDRVRDFIRNARLGGA
jgi:phosphoribosylanthranilate isomerase